MRSIAHTNNDVSDRMMGTLQVFTGLISFLFVTSADTPKLPYQTRLDLFMMFSFCVSTQTRDGGKLQRTRAAVRRSLWLRPH